MVLVLASKMHVASCRGYRSWSVECRGGPMLHKISILAVIAFAALWVTPAKADLIHDWDDDSTPHYSHDVRLDENLKVNAGTFSTFDRDVFKDEKSDPKRRHEFPSGGVPNTAEWIWWLNHSDKDKKEFGTDPAVIAPEPASLLLLGSGILALGGCRRCTNHSAPNA